MPTPPKQGCSSFGLKVLYARITIPIWKGAMTWEISLVNIMKCLLWAFAVSCNSSVSVRVPLFWQGLQNIPNRTETMGSAEINRLYCDQRFLGQRDCLGQEESNVAPYSRKGDGRKANLPQVTRAWKGWNRDLKEIHRGRCVGEEGHCVKEKERLSLLFCEWLRAVEEYA